MHNLGYTRSSHQPDHLLHTADTFVRTPRPGMRKATAIVHVSPERGARFTQYTAEFEDTGSLAPTAHQRFVYVLEGQLQAGEATLPAGCYAYLPSRCTVPIEAHGPTRAAVIEKPYIPIDPLPEPAHLVADENAVESTFLGGDPNLQVRLLLPNEPAFDFAVNTMTYQPGASLSMVEIHVMEHGCLMLEGGGIYRLGEKWYPVTAGDFIWMAPYCPQWFGALGKTPAKYLIYKDWNR